MQDWVVSRQLKTDPRRRRRRQLRRLHQAVRGHGRHRDDEVVQRHAAAGVHRARPRQRERRRQLSRAGRAAVPDSRHRHAALRRRHRRHRRRRAQRHAAAHPGYRANVTSAPCRARASSGRTTRTRSSSGIVLMRKGENPSEVLAAVKAAVAATEHRRSCRRASQSCPSTTARGSSTRRCTRCSATSLEGALLVIVVLYLFLGNVRAAGIVAVVIPLSLLATFIGLRIRGIPANLLSLGRDGLRHHRRRRGDRAREHLPAPVRADASSRRDAARPSFSRRPREVGRPTLFSMLIIIIVAHLPIFTLQRHEGRIFAPMAYTVVVGADRLAAVLADAGAAAVRCICSARAAPNEENVLVRWSKRLYRPALRTRARAPRLSCSAARSPRWPRACCWCRGSAPSFCRS